MLPRKRCQNDSMCCRGNKSVNYLKTVNVGFDGSGKTSLYHTFAWRKFPDGFLPTVFEGYTHDFDIDGKSVNLGFWDTHCGENHEYVELTRLYYPNTDVFTICFDVSNLDSFSNIREFWVDKEIRPLNSDAPLVLVATKTDLRGGSNECGTISRERGEQLAKEIGAAGYFEVSSLEMKGVDELFQSISEIGLKYRLKNSTRCRVCKIL